ncbi:MAG: type VI secretion system baseplate subunit TssF [Planctomycetes bacterium]|nr:type VI secretion system baseplate subunit TssF [Planctomycetota bacterium]
MSDELLPYYNKELAFIRKLGAEFAENHPEVAAALRIGPDACEDPHVERMIMAFAYLAARIRHKLDDDFPEITSSLLGVLYPHYLAPVPSMAIAEFQLDRGQGSLVEGYPVGRHQTIETEPVDGEPCRFRTCFPVAVWPIEVVSARLGVPPPTLALKIDEAAAVLRLEMKCFARDMTFAKLKLPKLRFYLNGQAQHVFALYELIFNNTLEVTLANSEKDPRPVRLGRGAVRTVGFEAEEGLLSYTPRSFLGYRLLTEFFTFPQKFCFFDIADLTPHKLSQLGNKIEICFYLGRLPGDLERNVTADTFKLGCAPMVNLFAQRAEPIRLTHTESEYRVVPDARRPLATEVYSIDRVAGTSPAGEETEYQPFYSFKHSLDHQKPQTFWYATRRPSQRLRGPTDHGTEMFLSLVDPGFNPEAPANWVVNVETTCLNRDLPKRLPFGGGQPNLQLAEGGPFSRIQCLTPPTPTLRPPLGNGALWRLISHLSLNHLSIADPEDKPDALREILKLYDFRDSPETRSKIDGVLKVATRRAIARVSGGGLNGFCRGIEVSIEFDEERFSDHGLFLFASVLERFLGLYCSINSFTQLSVKTKQRREVLRQWLPRASEKVLL